MIFALALIVSYIIGSIPVGYLIARLKGIDIREHGSGNIGTTNVWRNLGIIPGLITLTGDVAKGFLGVFIGLKAGGQGLEILCGMAAIAGHSWSVFLRFKGGKIIATGLGVIIAISYQVALFAIVVWLVTVAVSMYVSLGSLAAAITVPIFMYLLGLETSYVVFGIFIAIIAVYKHSSNIKRIIQGTENKIGR